MSSTIPLPPREQLCNRYCSNKQQLSSSPHAHSFEWGPAENKQQRSNKNWPRIRSTSGAWGNSYIHVTGKKQEKNPKGTGEGRHKTLSKGLRSGNTRALRHSRVKSVNTPATSLVVKSRNQQRNDSFCQNSQHHRSTEGLVATGATGDSPNAVRLGGGGERERSFIDNHEVT